MTYSEMDYEFSIVYDSIAGLQAPSYNKKMKSVLLTMAQEQLLKNRLNPQGNKYGDSFEETEKRKIEFSSLVKNTILTTNASTTANLTNGTFWEMPSNFWLAITERADIEFSSISGCYEIGATKTDVRIKPITHDYYMANINNPMKAPYEELIWRLNISSTLNSLNENENILVELVTDGKFFVSSYKIRYIAKPVPIILDTSIIRGVTGPKSCQLDEMIHSEIVRTAAELAVEISKDPQRFQTLKINNMSVE